ncbi:MFS transporter [Brevibacterium sp. UMB1308A]|uniref:MFS transporter n=1 Tax=Brevibacterium sp. UMB1308A TaxID=3050608 RepID=UPI00254C618B|nr:MFS transporter [Brevibacterium sp. UMB1308A]MDK8346899.1 MFS transporter [Brevibacterium sp. UMB1308B]MDK8713532.1 MFS transporter [Brevibacterium sp. UMB1308A]
MMPDPSKNGSIESVDAATSSTWVFLVAIVISGITTFMFYPLITLELIDRGVGAGATGLILGLLSGTGQILSGLIGAVNARLGSRTLAIGGLALRSVGLLVFAFDSNVLTYAVGAVVASLGSSSTALALKTELMRASSDRRTITMRSIAVNLGALVGPSIGGVVFVVASFSVIVLSVVTSYVLLGLGLLFVKFKPPEESGQDTKTRMRSDRRRLDRLFFVLIGCTLAYWGIYSQWPLVVPLYAESGFGTPLGSPWVYTGNAILILVLQYPLLVKLLKPVRSSYVLAIGFLLFVGSFLVLPIPAGPATVILFATLFSLAELLVSPTLDEVTAQLRREGTGLTRAYGATATAAGVSSLIGASAGGALIEHFDSPASVMYLAVPLAVLGFTGAVVLSRRKAGS